jgi:hypothetical protein
LWIPLTIDNVRAPTLKIGTVFFFIRTLELSSVRAVGDIVAALVGVVTNGDFDFGLCTFVSEDASEKRGERGRNRTYSPRETGSVPEIVRVVSPHLALRDALEASVTARVHGYALRSLPDVPAVVVAGDVSEKDLQGVWVRAGRVLGEMLAYGTRQWRERKLTMSPLGLSTPVELLGWWSGIADTRARQAASQNSSVVKAAIMMKVAKESELQRVGEEDVVAE